MSQVLEGNWEDLMAKHPELQGKRVRVIVLPEPPTPRTLGDLYGILRGVVSSSEQEIRAAEIEWDWTQQEPPNSR